MPGGNVLEMKGDIIGRAEKCIFRMAISILGH
jgi:hypothetical protein